MVETLWLVAGAAVAYVLVATVLQARGLLPEQIRVSGPITTIRTQYGKQLLDRLSRPKRLWRAWGNFGVGIALVVLVGSFLLIILSAVGSLVMPPPATLTQPRNILAIPGVNQFLPLSVAPEIIAGLFVGLVVHEGGHGLFCRVENIGIKSMGLALLTFVPAGAFVEPEERDRLQASRGGQTRMFAAGVTNNFAVAAIAFALLLGPVAGSIAVAAGVPVGGVIPGSPAAEAGVERGDVITAIDGQEVSPESLEATLANSSDRTVDATLEGGETVEIRRELVVVNAAANSPVGVNSTVTEVNGTAVATKSGFLSAVADRPVAELTTADGTSRTVPIGGLVTVLEGEPLAEAGAPAGTSLVITELNGQRIIEARDISEALSDTAPGDTVEVVAYSYPGGERASYTVELGEGGRADTGFLGVGIQLGTTGMVFDDFGVDVYPAGQFLSILSGEAEGIGGFLQQLFSLPFAQFAVPGAGYNFAGFTGDVANFYEPTGPLGGLGGGVFLLANLLFWVGWINLVIGQFNCIPAYPLDGGHLLRTSTEAVVSRLPISDGRTVTRTVTTGVSLVMFAGFGLLLLSSQLA
jgi:membrane-associated protease RseP (regulator of RpoE activity)